MNKLFNRNVFLDTLRQLMSLAILILIIGVIIVIVNRAIENDNITRYVDTPIAYNMSNVSLLVIMTFGGLALSLDALRFAWNKKRTDFEYSIPVTKGKLYTSKALAVISMQFALLFTISLTAFILSLEYLGRFIFLYDIIMSLVNASIGSLIIIGAVFLAVSVTGRALSSIILSIAIIAVPLIIPANRIYMITKIGHYFETALLHKPSLYIIFNNFISLPWIINFSKHIPSKIFSLFLAFIYLTLGYFLFQRRSGELTEVHTKNKLINFVVMGTIPFAAINIAVISFQHYLLKGNIQSKHINEAVTYLIISLVLILIYDVLANKKLRMKFSSICIFAILLIISAIMNYALDRRIKNIQYSKINLEQVESVNLATDGVSPFWWDIKNMSYGGYKSGNFNITDRDIIKMLTDINNMKKDFIVDGLYEGILVKFNLSSGKCIYKNIPAYDLIDIDKEIMIMNMVYNISLIPEFHSTLFTSIPMKHVTNVNIGKNILIKNDEEVMREVYKVFCDEYKILSPEQKYAVYGPWNGHTLLNSESIVIYEKLYVRGRVRGHDTVDLYCITELTPKTLEAYFKAMNTINLPEFEKFVREFNRNAEYSKNDIVRYDVFFNEHYLSLKRDDEDELGYFSVVTELLKDNINSSLSNDSNIIELKYLEDTTGTYCIIYLDVTEEVINELERLYTEFHN